MFSLNQVRKVGFLDLAIKIGQNKDGPNHAPHFFKKMGLKSLVKACGYQCSNGPTIYGEGINVYSEIFEQSKILLRNCDLPVFIGGDHSVSFSTITAVKDKYKNIGVIWVDAHPDLNTNDTSPSGNLHGMPVAGLLGLMPTHEVFGMQGATPVLRPGDIVYIGIRDIDDGEKSFLRKLGIKYFTANEVRQKGMQKVLLNAFTHFLSRGIKDIHLSFDIDCVDPEYVKATGTPVKDGLTPEDLKLMAEYLAVSKMVRSIDIVEFNPLVAGRQEALRTYYLIAEFVKIYFENRHYCKLCI